MGIDISVIVPAYNREKTIERAIRSIYAQTVQPFETIVVDDCSRDSTVQIVKELQKEYKTLSLFIQKENLGAQAARNVGIRNAKGNWIAFLDSDDEWIADKLELQIGEIKANPDCEAIFGDGYTAIGNALRYRKCGCFDKKFYSIEDAFSTEVMYLSILVKKDILESIGLLDEKVPAYQEMDTRLRIAAKCDFLYISKPLFKYYMHPGETISKNVKKQLDGYRYVLLKNMGIFKEINGFDVVEKYYFGMDIRSVSFVDKFFYHGILSLYHANPKVMNRFLEWLMKLEYTIRY